MTLKLRTSVSREYYYSCKNVPFNFLSKTCFISYMNMYVNICIYTQTHIIPLHTLDIKTHRVL